MPVQALVCFASCFSGCIVFWIRGLCWVATFSQLSLDWMPTHKAAHSGAIHGNRWDPEENLLGTRSLVWFLNRFGSVWCKWTGEENIQRRQSFTLTMCIKECPTATWSNTIAKLAVDLETSEDQRDGLQYWRSSTRGFESVGIRLLVSCLLPWQNTKQKRPKRGGMIYSSSWFRSYSSKGQGRRAIGLSHRRSDKWAACSEMQTARRTGARLQWSKPMLLATYLR